MYFYLAMVGFEPTPTSTAAPSNTETTVIPSQPLRSLKKELSWPRFMLDLLYIGRNETNIKQKSKYIYIRCKCIIKKTLLTHGPIFPATLE